MKNQNVLFALIGIVAGYFILTNKSGFSLPQLKANKDIVEKSYEDYYSDGSSRVTTPFGEQHEATIAESQTIGTVGGGLKDIWESIVSWKNKRDYEKQLGEIKTAEEVDLFYEA